MLTVNEGKEDWPALRFLRCLLWQAVPRSTFAVQKPDTGVKRSEVRSQKSEVRSQSTAPFLVNTRTRKIYEKVLSGSRNVRFDDLCRLAKGFGFSLDRTSGSHHIFRHGSGLMLNLQPGSNGQAKPYQIRQLLDLVEENGLRLGD